MTTPVVLIHGWASSNAIWRPLSNLIEGREAICLSLPGYGESEDGKWCDPIEFVAQSLPSKCHLVGWSLGGNVAMAIAQRYPEKIASVATIATVPNFVANEAWPWAMPQKDFAAFFEGMNENPAITLKRFSALQSRGDKVMKQVAKVLKAQPCQAKNGVLIESLQWLGQTQQRVFWQKPTANHLAIFAEYDALVPVDAAQHVSNAKVINDAGHAVLLSKAAEVHSELEALWQTQ